MMTELERDNTVAFMSELAQLCRKYGWTVGGGGHKDELVFCVHRDDKQPIAGRSDPSPMLPKGF